VIQLGVRELLAHEGERGRALLAGVVEIAARDVDAGAGGRELGDELLELEGRGVDLLLPVLLAALPLGQGAQIIRPGRRGCIAPMCVNLGSGDNITAGVMGHARRILRIQA
jgi:hypothetical protein